MLSKYFKEISKPKKEAHKVVPVIIEHKKLKYNKITKFRDVFISTNGNSISTSSFAKFFVGAPVPYFFDSLIKFLEQDMKDFDYKRDVFSAEVVAKDTADLISLRQASEYKTRSELSKVLSNREIVIGWIESGKPISINFANKYLSHVTEKTNVRRIEK